MIYKLLERLYGVSVRISVGVSVGVSLGVSVGVYVGGSVCPFIACPYLQFHLVAATAVEVRPIGVSRDCQCPPPPVSETHGTRPEELRLVVMLGVCNIAVTSGYRPTHLLYACPQWISYTTVVLDHVDLQLINNVSDVLIDRI